MKREIYESALKPLQLRLVQMSEWARANGERILILFEGRDTAGKSGAINAIASVLNPRHSAIVALPTPSAREQSQWYFQRYVPHLPAAGEIVLFDRSWYNRAGVEHVMGFCTDAQYQAFLNQTPTFERLLVEDGIRLFKYWLTVDQDEQEARFQERVENPLKRWKLSPMDLQAREKYAQYGEARDAMLKATHSKSAPWTLIDFNDQRVGRLTLINHFLDALPMTTVDSTPLALPELSQPLKKETFSGPLTPIAPFTTNAKDSDNKAKKNKKGSA